MAAFHLDQAVRNHRAYQVMRREGLVDWAMTALFYTALHCVDNWLEERGQPVKNHHERQRALSRSGIPWEVYAGYRALLNYSRLVRYEDWQPYFGEETLEEVYTGAYATVCQFFGAPEAIWPTAGG
jgi:hypothetical protein